VGDEATIVTAGRLHLLEGLLSSTSVAAGAGHALLWLEETVSSARSLCLVPGIGESGVRVIASRGFSENESSSRRFLHVEDATALFSGAPPVCWPIVDQREAHPMLAGFILHAGRSLREEDRQWFVTMLARRFNQLATRDGVPALKARLFSNLSHEFRTPLNAMRGYTSMLRQGVAGELPPTALRQLARIEVNGQQLDVIVSAIIDICLMEAGQMPIAYSAFDVGEMVKETVGDLAPLFRDSGLSMAIDMPSGLPPIMSDRIKVKQIVGNLVSNAVKFTHEGGVTVSAKFLAAVPCLQMTVADTGIGIAAADHARVFDDFRQVDDSLTRAYGGVGLGLSLCQRLAHLLGGSITVQSELGRGARFVLTLPTGGRA
jgi:signal transduction histidine kinase